MNELKMKIAALALNEMMRKPFFSICAVTDAADVLGCNPRLSVHYDDLRALHCIDWRRMPEELRRAVPVMIAECLALPPQFILADEKPLPTMLPLLQALSVMPGQEALAQNPSKRPLLKRIFARLAE